LEFQELLFGVVWVGGGNKTNWACWLTFQSDITHVLTICLTASFK